MSRLNFGAKIIKKEDIWLFLYFCRVDSTYNDEKKSLVIIEYEEIVSCIVRFVECDFVRARGLDGAFGAQYASAG